MRLSRKSRSTPYRPTQIPPVATRAETAGDGAPATVVTKANDNIGPLVPAREGIALPTVIVMVVMALILGVLLVLFVQGLLTSSVFAPRPPAATEVTEPPKAAVKPPPPRSLTSRAWTLWHEAGYDPFRAEALDEKRSFQPARVFPAGVDILEGATLQSEQTRIRLSYIVSVAPGAICQSEQATKFACGLMARASLSILVSGSKLFCYPDVSMDTDTPKFICFARGQDLSLAQIEAGYALPATHSVPVLEKLAEDARARHVGVWRGDWTLVPPGGEALVAPAAAQ